ncbi:MAG: M3 family oligoendopeptidase [Candidatus Aenigmarchaeota archaeon]|nr:M3 family oligoendopeptidase [Candidatus Aenigmarchaeota archaeon]
MKEEKLLWNLRDIISNDSKFLEMAKNIENEMQKLDFFFEKLSPSMDKSEFRKMIFFEEALEEKMAMLGTYSFLIYAQNMKSQKAMKYKSINENLSIKISDKSRPIGHWIKGFSVKGKERLDDKNAEKLFSSVPKMKYAFMRDRESAKHTLSQKEESIITRKDMNGISVVTELYGKIVNDLRFEMNVRGKTKRLTLDEITSLFHNADREKRKEAYKSVFNVYGCNREKFFTIYSAIVKDWLIESQLRKYPSPISMRNFVNDIDDNAVGALIESCTKNRKIFWDFFRLKARALGMKKLSRYDLHAPIKEKKKYIPFAEARKTVLSTFSEFSPSFRKKADILFRGHIDSHPRKDKMAGGSCSSVTPKITPYILLNYTGKSTDVSTLAHELGHAIHDAYASKNPISIYHAPLPLCETASTFCEMIAFEKLLEEASKEEKISLLSDKMKEFYATISRQNYFIKFELKAHENIPKGLTEDELSEIYIKNLKEEFGPAVQVPEEFRYEWSFIPHIFHTPFYCYSYNFGELLALSLYSGYKEEGKNFIPKIEAVLEAGGSENPRKLLLRSAGIDIDDSRFWDRGFDIVRNFNKELSDLILH